MKRNSKTARITIGAMLAALSIILPQIFHLTGIPQVGSVFLPMHIPVLLSGFILGPACGTAIGLFAPIASFLITNMPSAERLPFMVVELAVYGLFSGLMFHTFKLKTKQFGIAISLLSAMLVGRLAFAFALFCAAEFFKIPCGGAMAAVTATASGVYGIVLQIVTIPPIVYALKRSDFIK